MDFIVEVLFKFVCMLTITVLPMLSTIMSTQLNRHSCWLLNVKICPNQQVQQEDKDTAGSPREEWDAWDPMLISEGLFSAANIFRQVFFKTFLSLNFSTNNNKYYLQWIWDETIL